jgi:hypothetical protein
MGIVDEVGPEVKKLKKGDVSHLPSPQLSPFFPRLTKTPQLVVPPHLPPARSRIVPNRLRRMLLLSTKALVHVREDERFGAHGSHVRFRGGKDQRCRVLWLVVVVENGPFLRWSGVC